MCALSPPPPNNEGAKQFYYTNWNFMSDKHTARKIGSAQMDFEVKITARARERETREIIDKAHGVQHTHSLSEETVREAHNL